MGIWTDGVTLTPKDPCPSKVGGFGRKGTTLGSTSRLLDDLADMSFPHHCLRLH